MDNVTMSEQDEATARYENSLINFSAVTMTVFSGVAFIVNVYLLNVSFDKTCIQEVQNYLSEKYIFVRAPWDLWTTFRNQK